MHIATLLLALLPLVQVHAGLFPANGPVKMLDTKGFRKAMRRNETSIVAFVAPWCGHCQRLVPELSKAATALGGSSFNPGSDAAKPMIPAYAVDCDADENKALCGEMGVQGFPTVKIFPRGKYGGVLDYNDERSAAAIAKTVRSKVPGKVDKVQLSHKGEEREAGFGGRGGHEGWKKVKGKAGDENTIHAVLLQSPHKNNGKPPLMWKVLATTFGEHNIRFGIDTTTFADASASASSDSSNAQDNEKVKKNWEKDSEVWVYAKGEKERAVKWDGKNKFDALRAFFTSIVRGEDVLERMVKEQYPEATHDEKAKVHEEL